MKRKYDCPKVKVGDLVYFYDDFINYETKHTYRVIVATDNDVLVEVRNNNGDDNIKGWPVNKNPELKKYGLPHGIRCWYIKYWRKASIGMEIE